MARRALLLSGADLARWRREHAAGDRPAVLPYGAEALEHNGFRVDGVQLSDWRVATKARDVVEHRLGIPVARTVKGAVKVARADLVIASLEREAIAMSALRRAHVPPYRRAPLVALTCWLADDARGADEATRAQLLARFANVDAFVYWSRNQTPILRELGIAERKLVPVGFCADTDYFTPDPSVPQDIDLLAVGQDGGRDYATLFDAVRGTDLVVDIVCPVIYLPPDIPQENVRLHGVVDSRAYAAMLRRAKVVVVPTHERAYPTGQSVALEASATGACVVVTGSTPLREYFTHEQDALLVDVHDPADLRARLRQALGDEALRRRVGAGARANVTGRFTADIMWRDILTALRDRDLLAA
ncbi:glycosyltransferase family 4 protein [Allobranchiibius sp. GilTou73]|uniref:glycosyltransferase family 4 protein n=1 Tax=Allobranchiibius sp. GilTou73 TaxID=2904523 RepID=UPI001F4575D2|nr:glycosyltransferase family 4 protein [Allobranchiibius sp. GilTou73]UIJ35544.1 glycosyltransferase family 4 protein [Allobranchiibius sp. GilTou73]